MVEIRSDAFHVVKADGEEHSLVIKQMRANNAGLYCVTAVNAAGRALCSATLYICSGETRTEMEGFAVDNVYAVQILNGGRHIEAF